MLPGITFTRLQEWTHGALSAKSPSESVKNISSDTRTIKPGDVFIALKGENFDGHDYLKKATELGAHLLITEKKADFECNQLVVPNTLHAYVAIGKGLRDLFQGPVVAVTGSAGKSSTRDMVATLLGDHTLKAPASFNNLLGVSKTLCLLEPTHKKLVLEVGMNHLGEIREICEAFRPTAGLITNVGDAHIGFLGSQENIFKAKKELFDFLGASKQTLGVAVNVDDPYVHRAWKEAVPASVRTISYSANQNAADIRILEKSIDPRTCYLNLKFEIQGEKVEASCKLFGLHHAQNAVAAIAMATLLGVPKKEIKERLGSISPAPHRGQIVQLPQGVTLIDESYNSNPTALKSSLDSLSHLNPKRRRLVVIGEMRELGEFSEKLHRETGQYFANAVKGNQGILVTVGNHVKFFQEEATKGCTFQGVHVENWESAYEVVRAELKPEDIVQVKGSHGVRLDLLVDRLTQGN